MKLYLLYSIYDNDIDHYNTLYCSHNKDVILNLKKELENDIHKYHSESFILLEFKIENISNFNKWLDIIKKTRENKLNLDFYLFFDILKDNDYIFIDNFKYQIIDINNINIHHSFYNSKYHKVNFLYE
jgi:hypothetical protein